MAAGKPKVTKLKRRLAKIQVMETNQELLALTLDELQAIALDPDEAAYRKITAGALVRAIEDYNLHILGWVYDHTYGKPSQQIQLDAEINHTHENIKSMTTAQIIRMIKSDVKALEGEK